MIFYRLGEEYNLLLIVISLLVGGAWPAPQFHGRNQHGLLIIRKVCIYFFE